MGEVWLAEDRELHEQVALKALHPQLSVSPEMVALLKNECRNTRRLVHPNIVRLFDFHRVDEWAFISMEYVDGSDFQQFLGTDFGTVIPVVIPVIEALEYAHGLGIVHRDLKASNILCDAAGTPHLADFGIAGVTLVHPDTPTINSGGTPHRMSPQQLMGHAPTPADDIYALGVLFYELTTGTSPFSSDIGTDALPPIQAVHPLPEGAADLIARMLARSPAERPQSMAAVKRALGEIQHRAADRTIPPTEHEPHQRSRLPVEHIAVVPPPPPVVPARQIHERRTRHKRTRRAVLLLSAFALLLAAIGAVFLYLPQMARQQLATFTPPDTSPELIEGPLSTPQVRTEPASESDPTTATAPERGAVERAAAEEAMGIYIRKHEALDAQAVGEWGGADYSVAHQLASEGDDYFRQRAYAAATEAYRNAVTQLDTLEARRDILLQEALVEGAEALGKGNSDTAAERFSFVLTIDAAHTAAQQGLARAKTIEKVLALLSSGHAHEENNELILAQADYDAAVALDPEFTEARTAAEQVAGAISAQRFQRAMSEGLTALNVDDFASAGAAFEAARALRPDSQAATDGLLQSEAAIRLRQIASHRGKAGVLEQEERWAEAAQEYQAALNLDPTILFAQEGNARTLKRAELAARMAGYLGHPSRLTSPEVHDRAVALIRDVSLIENKGPKLGRQLSSLEALVELAGTPVPVQLQSDNSTEVAVYRVGRFGKFTTRDLKLRPGTYTVVGTRDGYRDVRKEITILPGKAIGSVVVRCDEKI